MDDDNRKDKLERIVNNKNFLKKIYDEIKNIINI